MLTAGRSIDLLPSAVTYLTDIDFQIASNVAVPIKWTAVSANSASGLVSISEDRLILLCVTSGIYSISYSMNINLSETKGNLSSQKDVTVSYLSVNGVRIQRSSGYGNPIDLISGDFSVYQNIRHRLNKGDTLELYVRRLGNQGTLRIQPGECSITCELRSLSEYSSQRLEL